MVKRTGLKGVSPYTIRHTVATELTARGVDFANVRLFLGHSMKSLGVTGGYIHFRPDFLLAARDAIDQFFAALSLLLIRPIVRIVLKEQPLPSALHAQCTPKIEELHDAVDANVLNDVVGVKGFAMVLQCLYEYVCVSLAGRPQCSRIRQQRTREAWLLSCRTKQSHDILGRDVVHRLDNLRSQLMSLSMRTGRPQ